MKITPFRWNIEQENELGSLTTGLKVDLYPGFMDELMASSARILAFAGNASLYFVGRSPENYFDFLSGVFSEEEAVKAKINLFQFSGRSQSLKQLKRFLPQQLESLKVYMESIGLSPSQIMKRKTKTAFVDVVYRGGTFNTLIEILQDWALELKVDWNAVRKKIRIVGITERTKNSPNTWRWQQQVDWIDLIGSAQVKNVSVSPGFWYEIADEQCKTTASFRPKRWNDPKMEKPYRAGYNREGLNLALHLYKFGQGMEGREGLRMGLVGQQQMKFAWFKGYVKALK